MLYTRHYLEKGAASYLSEALVGHFTRNPAAYSEIAIVCVGTNSYSWDSLGPLVGNRLSSIHKDNQHVRIFGTMDKPVHALNLNKFAGSYLSSAGRDRQSPYVVAVDACLGQYYKIGTLQFAEEPLAPGSVLGKELQTIGHVHLKGVVNNYSALNLKVLEHTSLTFIEAMADVIADTLSRAIRAIEPMLAAAPSKDDSRTHLNLG